MKTIYRILAALAVAGVLLAVVVLAARGAKGEDAVMTSTETAPIYNHFPICQRQRKSSGAASHRAESVW